MIENFSSTKSNKKRFQGLSINRLIPNMLTLLALSAGLTAIRFAFDQKWEHSVLAIFAAGILDALDGRIARLLKGSTKFGAELDSLSDFVCFGVAPGLILYLWTMQASGKFGWVLIMLFSICCGLRLARFNVMLENSNAPAWQNNFFVGIPAPMGGALVLLPMIFSFQFGGDFFRQPWISGTFLLVLSGLMVSNIPTYSFKNLKISRNWILPTMLITGGIAISIINAPWISLSLIGSAYIATIPLSYRAHRNLQKNSTDK